MSTTLATILKPALRRAGITKLPGITPSTDQYGELIPEANRLLDMHNCNGHVIFNTKIEAFDLTSGQKQYSIGPGGDFNTARPISISEANFIFPGSPAIRIPVDIIDDEQWSKITMQDIAGAPPWWLYYDGSNDANGRGQIYIVGQPPSGYQLELFSWQALQANFTASTDVVTWPPGYEFFLETNLALCACALYPEQSTVAKNALAYSLLEKQARQSLIALITFNSKSPVLRSEMAFQQGGRAGMAVLQIGGGGQSVNWVQPTLPADGIRTTFTFSGNPKFISFGGINQFVNALPGYIVVAARTVSFTDATGAIIAPDPGTDIRAELN